MTTKLASRLPRGGALLIAGALAACSILEPRPDPTRFYVLTAEASVTSDAAIESPEALGVGPVTLPSYLARPEIVRRGSANEIEPSRIERWGEPLDSAIMRTLAENLELLTKRRVLQYPWLLPGRPSSQAAVELLRFEPAGGSRVELVANVTLTRFADNVSSMRREEIQVELPAQDGGSVAAAMSTALLELARRIAAAEVQLGGSR